MKNIYWWGYNTMEQAPWAYCRGNTPPLFYQGVYKGKPFVASQACEGWGNYVSPPSLRFAGEAKKEVSEKFLEDFLASCQRVLAPQEKRIARIVKKPFWTIATGPAAGDYEWVVVCPHGYETGAGEVITCPAGCEIPWGHESNIVAVFDSYKGLRPFTVYSLPEAQRIMYPGWEDYLTSSYGEKWTGFPQYVPWEVKKRREIILCSI